MKYISFKLNDGIDVKFKIVKRNSILDKITKCEDLFIVWKYTEIISTLHYIQTNTVKHTINDRMNYLNSLSSRELIHQFQPFIEKQHESFKTK